MTTPEEPKQPRKRRGTNDFGSKTKPKGTPVVGKQAETLFGSVRGNPAGCTKEAALRRHQAAEIAATVQLEFLQAYAKKIKEIQDKSESADQVIELVNAHSLKLLDSVMDRAFGKAGSTIDLTSSDGTMSPVQSQADAILEAIKRKHDPNS